MLLRLEGNNLGHIILNRVKLFRKKSFIKIFNEVDV